MSVFFAEITGDTAILEAESKLQYRDVSRMPNTPSGTSGTLA
jgi:hypothetical protein